MRSGWINAAGVSAVVAVICLAGSGIAAADNVVPDGDGAVPLSANGLNLGTVCVQGSAGTSALVGVNRNGSATGTNTFKNGATVTVSVQSVTGTGLTAQMFSNTITLPGNWTSLANNTVSDAVRSDVNFAAGATPGPFSGTVTYAATGVNADGATITRTAQLPVTAAVSDTGACAPAPADTTAPAVTVSFPGPIAGSNGWFNAGDVTPVLGTLTAADASGVADISCTGANVGGLSGLGEATATGQLTVSGDGVHEVTCTARDGAGNTGAAAGSANTATVKIDTTAPVITDAGPSAGPDGANGWYVSPVSESFAAADTASGLADCDPAFTATSTGEGSAVTVASGPCADLAGNTNDGVQAGPYRVDLTDPTVSCDPGQQFTLQQSGASVTAAVADETSGPASAQATAPADTSTVGGHSVDVTGYDNAGRSATVSCAYSVIYAWHGFFAPVNNAPTLNVAKAGSAIPVKFSLAGNQGLAITAADSPSSRAVDCNTQASTDTVETTVTAGSSSLSYDPAADQYTYVWKTDKAWAGTCRQLNLTLADGTNHTANFQFSK